MKKNIAVFCLCCTVLLLPAQVPSRPVPPRLVCDFAGMMSPEESSSLEKFLVSYEQETSTQICVVTLNDIGGQDILHLAYEIGETWGVGSDKFNNGAVILIKDKMRDSKGEVAIATGYGQEAVLTDAICRRIIENELIPHFQEGETYEGIQAACHRMITLLDGEFSYEQEDREALIGVGVFLAFCILLFIILVIAINRYNKKHPDKPIRFDGNGKGGPTIIIGGDGRRFGSSGSSFGGGFGGFGGGSFGGGGAKGSW